MSQCPICEETIIFGGYCSDCCMKATEIGLTILLKKRKIEKEMQKSLRAAQKKVIRV